MVNNGMHDSRILIAVLCLVTALNFGLVGYFFAAKTDATVHFLSAVQLYALAALEIAVITVTYRANARRQKTAIAL